MQLLLLLTYHEDIEHKKVEIELDENSTLLQMQQNIYAKTRIDLESQLLYFDDGREISGFDINSTLLEIGLRNLDRAIVKHTELSWWPQYKEYVELAMKGGPRKMQLCKEAVRLHADLMDNGFFHAYRRFNAYRMQNHYKVASWTDGDTKLMREATLSHFRTIHVKQGANDELDFVCRFEPRPAELGGLRKNTLAYVRLHGEQDETKYNLKFHHFGSSSSSAKGQSPDIKEFFCYKLLELIKVGPQWKGTKDAAIVDFMPRAYHTFTNVKKALLKNDASIHWDVFHIDALEESNEKSRLEMAKACLMKWDLLAKIGLANELINPEKDRMKRQDIGFKGFNSPAEELDQYITVVKQNITNLIDILNVDE